MSKCLGCGAELQTIDAHAIGYTPKAEAQYCQRCFRLRHYGDFNSSILPSEDNQEIFDSITKIDALFFWVVDLFDFESSFVENINRHLRGKDIIMVLTKRDLLPMTLSQNKLNRFVKTRLNEYDVSVLGYIVTGDYGYDGREEILSAINTYRGDRDVVFFGMANVGKSTLLNSVFENQDITTSPYPGTTLATNYFAWEDYRIYDTPGYNNKYSVLWNIDLEQLKTIVPNRLVAPRIFQIHEDQSFAIGGIARLDVKTKGEATAVFYFSGELSLHRGKLEKADSLWEKHLGTLLQPTLQDNTMKRKDIARKSENMDIAIPGLGWVSLKGQFQEIALWIHPDLFVNTREAMI